MISITGPHLASAMMQTPASEREIARIDYYPVVCAAVLLLADCLAMTVAAAIVFRLKVLHWPGPGALFPAGGLATRLDLAILFTAMVLYFAVRSRYREPIPFWAEARLVVGASLCAIGGEAVFELLTRDLLSPTSVIIVLLLFPVLATCANWLAKRVLSLAGPWALPVVVVGEGASAGEAALEADRSLGYRFVGRVSPEDVLSAPAGNRLWPVLARFKGRRLLIVAQGERQRQLVKCALRERVPFALMPSEAFPAFPFEPTMFFSHDVMLLSFRDGLSRPIARVTKVVFDVCVAAFLLALTSPLFLVLVIANWLAGGPTFYAHRRIGVCGRPFNCLKFRTMVVDGDRVLADALAKDAALTREWEATRKLVNDPRVTPVGRFLRSTSLDELPQLINVLRLEMSLVGPRPIVESEVPLYGEDIAQYYAIRPGLTGLWQVSGRSNVSYEKRVQLDVWYVNNWAIWHDIVVLLKTIPAVLGRQGAV